MDTGLQVRRHTHTHKETDVTLLISCNTHTHTHMRFVLTSIKHAPEAMCALWLR